MNASITFNWHTTTPLSIHSGHARAGGADRVVRLRDDRPVIPGEAIKGAIRETAELILCRLGLQPHEALEARDRSVPQHPAICRLFAADWATAAPSAARYRFYSASALMAGDAFETFSTSIDLVTGVAKERTLRSVEVWSPGLVFPVEIQAFAGDWSEGRSDRQDLWLLLMAIAATDAIGGGWGVGRGEIAVEDLCATLPGERLAFNWDRPLDPELGAWLERESACKS